MATDCVPDLRLDSLYGVPRRDAARQVRHIGRIVAFRFFDYDRVPHHRCSFRPACFKILFCVPGAKSSEGLPAMATRPDLLACLNSRWLPRVATKYHASSSTNRLASRAFTSTA